MPDCPAPFTPYADLGSPADLIRRFGVARRKVGPWSLLACAASPLILGFWRSKAIPRAALFLDEPK
jgi:hypothetical protein